MLNNIVGFLLIIPVYFILMLLARRKKVSIKKHIFLLLFCCYLGIVIAVTLFPLPYNSEFIKQNREWNYLHNNFIPFKSICELITDNPRSIAIRNILGNIVLAMPFGFLICVLFKKCRNIKAVFISGVCFSLIIELSQFILSLFLGYTYKITDIDDLILNTIGAVLGFLSYKLIVIIKE